MHPYDYGTVVTLEATAASGSTFDGWSGDPDCTDGSVTMNADKACTATFTQLNTAPVAVDDTYNTNEDVQLNVGAPGVLENDTDADPLTAVLVDGPQPET